MAGSWLDDAPLEYSAIPMRLAAVGVLVHEGVRFGVIYLALCLVELLIFWARKSSAADTYARLYGSISREKTLRTLKFMALPLSLVWPFWLGQDVLHVIRKPLRTTDTKLIEKFTTGTAYNIKLRHDILIAITAAHDAKDFKMMRELLEGLERLNAVGDNLIEALEDFQKASEVARNSPEVRAAVELLRGVKKRDGAFQNAARALLGAE